VQILFSYKKFFLATNSNTAPILFCENRILKHPTDIDTKEKFGETELLITKSFQGFLSSNLSFIKRGWNSVSQITGNESKFLTCGHSAAQHRTTKPQYEHEVGAAFTSLGSDGDPAVSTVLVAITPPLKQNTVKIKAGYIESCVQRPNSICLK